MITLAMYLGLPSAPWNRAANEPAGSYPALARMTAATAKPTMMATTAEVIGFLRILVKALTCYHLLP